MILSYNYLTVLVSSIDKFGQEFMFLPDLSKNME